MTEPVAASEAVPPLAGALLPHCRRDLDTLRRFVHTLISQEAPAKAVSAAEFQEVLLTGATGFVGRFVLRDLLQHNEDLVVHCIVRAKNAKLGLERLRTAMEFAEIWEESFAPRIQVVVGDITESRFGLDEVEFDDLCRRIDAVYHIAADLNLTSPYIAIRKANTFSIRNVLELCLRTRFKHVFYASSLGVFPQYFCGFSNEFAGDEIDHQMQPQLAEMKRIFPLGFLGYPWSKLVSEQALLYSQAAGLPVAIFRLPRTCRASTGFIAANDVSVRVFAAVLDVGILPPGFTMQRNNEAVDVLSRIITGISTNPKRRFTIYHCCDPHPVHRELELEDFGLYLKQDSYAAFKHACQARGEDSPLHGHWGLMEHFADYWFIEREAGTAPPICDRAIREDHPDTIQWPSLYTMIKRTGDWVSRHEDEWPHPVPEARLDFDCLVGRARDFAGRAGVPFGQAYPEWMLENLRHLVEALNLPEARIRKDKLRDLAFDLTRLLHNNSMLTQERLAHPEMDHEAIDQPVFIVGINRTGTTYLHRLMARDPRFWTLRLYEFVDPVLHLDEHAETALTQDDPRRDFAWELIQISGISEQFKGTHRFDVDEPEEDFPILRQVFASWVSAIRFHVPEFVRWLETTGCNKAYAYHRRTIQQLTYHRRHWKATRGGRQWLLKMPFHLMELETLINTYPDALFIQTHRDPVQFVGSWNSLIERIRSLAMESEPRHEMALDQLDFLSRMLDRAIDFRQSHPELERRWMDVNYYELVEDPMSVVEKIYAHFGWPLDPAVTEEMEDWLFWQSEQRSRETRHKYSLEEFGLTAETVNSAFARYRDFVTTCGIRGGSAP